MKVLRVALPPYQTPRNEWRKEIHKAVVRAMRLAKIAYSPNDRFGVEIEQLTIVGLTSSKSAISFVSRLMATIALERHLSAQRQPRAMFLRHSRICSLTSSVRSHQQPSPTGGGTSTNVASS
jgi:hypothetical protein